VPDALQNRDLAIDSLQVRSILDLLLLKDFYRHLFVGGVVRALLDLTECAFALRFADGEVADLFVFFFGRGGVGSCGGPLGGL